MVRIFAIAAVALLAGACAHHPPPAPAPTPAALDLPPLPRPKPETHAHSATPPAPSPDLVLVGLNRADIEAALGEPSTRVEEGASQSWIYRGTRCKVELTLFFDVSRNDFYALDRRIDGTDGTEKAAQRCLKQIRDAHAAKPPETGKPTDAGKTVETARMPEPTQTPEPVQTLEPAKMTEPAK